MRNLYRPRHPQQAVRRKKKGHRRAESHLRTVSVLFLAILAGASVGAAGGALCSLWLADRVISASLFNLEGVSVQGGRILTEVEIANSAGVVLGESILAADLEEMRRRLLRHPLVRNAVVARKLPSELAIEIEERTPAAIIASDRTHPVDRDGHFLNLPPESLPGGLPCFSGIRADKDRISDEGLPDLRDGIELMAAIRSFGFPPPGDIACVDLSKRNDAVLLPEGPGPQVHLGRENIYLRLQRWKIVAADLGEKMQTLEYLDLRADGQVIAKPRNDLESEDVGEVEEGLQGEAGNVPATGGEQG